MARFCTVADAAARNFFVEEQYKEDEIIRLSGATSRFRLRWRLAKQCALKDLRICGQETRTVSRTVGCQTEWSNMKATIGGTSVD